MTTGPGQDDHACEHLTAIGAALTADGIACRLTRSGTPSLTIEDHAGPGGATVINDPGAANDPGPWIDCTWTPAPGTTPEATAAAITAVLNAIRPGSRTSPGTHVTWRPCWPPSPSQSRALLVPRPEPAMAPERRAVIARPGPSPPRRPGIVHTGTRRRPGKIIFIPNGPGSCPSACATANPGRRTPGITLAPES
jgi:hypothetical protein